MDVGNLLRGLGLGLSRLLRYLLGGVMLLTLPFLMAPESLKHLLREVPWQLTTACALVVGVVIYAAHRSVLIPLHHTTLCFVFWVLDWRVCHFVQGCDSTSPTRWLGAALKVPRWRRILAYEALRQGEFFDEDERERLNVDHAENGLLVMFSACFLLAWIYATAYPCNSKLGSTLLGWLSLGSLLSSYPRAIIQHRLECMRFQASVEDVRSALQERGILPRNA